MVKFMSETENLFFITEVALFFYGPLIKSITLKEKLLKLDIINHLDPVDFESFTKRYFIFKDNNKLQVVYQNKKNNIFSITFLCKINIKNISNIATLFSNVLKS